MQKKLMLGLALTMACSTAFAENSLTMKPGYWKSKSTHTGLMGTQPMSREDSECVTPEKAIFSAEKLVKEMGEGCKVLQSKTSGNELTFSASCEQQGMSSVLTGNYVKDSDEKLHGTMDMEVSFSGQKQKMSFQFESQRVGDCPDK